MTQTQSSRWAAAAFLAVFAALLFLIFTLWRHRIPCFREGAGLIWFRNSCVATFGVLASGSAGYAATGRRLYVEVALVFAGIGLVGIFSGAALMMWSYYRRNTNKNESQTSR